MFDLIKSIEQDVKNASIKDDVHNFAEVFEKYLNKLQHVANKLGDGVGFDYYGGVLPSQKYLKWDDIMCLVDGTLNTTTITMLSLHFQITFKLYIKSQKIMVFSHQLKTSDGGEVLRDLTKKIESANLTLSIG